MLADWITGGIIDAKFFGVLAMFGSMLVLALAPWLDTSSVRSGRYRPMFKWWFYLLVIDFVVLMWCGAMPAEPPYSTIALIGSTYWFAYFLVILPLLGVLEKPLPQPATIEDDFAAAHPAKGEAGARHPFGAAARSAWRRLGVRETSAGRGASLRGGSAEGEALSTAPSSAARSSSAWGAQRITQLW